MRLCLRGNMLFFNESSTTYIYTYLHTLSLHDALPISNVIPTALISNGEIVTGGASAAYGSDAVAGVVNFTLERNLEEFRGDLSYAQTKYDDFHRPAVSLASGHGVMDDRLHVEAAFDYLRNSGQTSKASRP